MIRRSWQTTLTVASLLVVSLLLSGCPKKPAPAAGAGAGPAAGAGAVPTTGTGPGTASGQPGAGGATPGTIGTGPGTTAGGPLGAGPGAGTPGAGAGPSTAAGTPGTTIPALPSPKEFVETSALRDIFFDFDKYEIRAGDAKTLEQNAGWLKSNANALLLIEGHADERGTNEYNLALGERRAKATRDHLVSLGITAARITVISYGEERPVCTERTEACWAKNRRAHFLVKQ